MSAPSAPSAPAESPTGPAAGALALGLARRWRGLTLAAVVLLALVGWGFLVAAVAFGGTVADMGYGMVALRPLLERIAAAHPAFAALGGGHGPLMPAMAAWGPADLALVLLMWAAMVFAMMIPTAAPTFRAYAPAGGRAAAAVVAGYTTVWLAVSVVATAAQALMTTAGVLQPHMAPAGIALSASVLVAAGLYQFTPLKRVCLLRCRAPVPFAAAGPGTARAFRIGLEEGLACLGCCWALMAVMFAAGLMNLVAMAFLGALMGTEKLVNGFRLTYVIGGILLAGGAFLSVGVLLG